MTREQAINIALGCVFGSDLKMSEKSQVADILIGLQVDEESEEE